jgi:thioredoxin 1
MVEIKEIKNNDDYKSFIEMDKENLHIIKFGAKWCGPCRSLEVTLHGLDSEKIKDSLFASIDVDTDDMSDIIANYSVRSVPTMVFIKNGEVKKTLIGASAANKIYEIIDSIE